MPSFDHYHMWQILVVFVFVLPVSSLRFIEKPEQACQKDGTVLRYSWEGTPPFNIEMELLTLHCCSMVYEAKNTTSTQFAFVVDGKYDTPLQFTVHDSASTEYIRADVWGPQYFLCSWTASTTDVGATSALDVPETVEVTGTPTTTSSMETEPPTTSPSLDAGSRTTTSSVATTTYTSSVRDNTVAPNFGAEVSAEASGAVITTSTSSSSPAPSTTSTTTTSGTSNRSSIFSSPTSTMQFPARTTPKVVTITIDEPARATGVLAATPHSLNPSTVAGIAIGSMIAALLLLLALYLGYKQHRRRQRRRPSEVHLSRNYFADVLPGVARVTPFRPSSIFTSSPERKPGIPAAGEPMRTFGTDRVEMATASRAESTAVTERRPLLDDSKTTSEEVDATAHQQVRHDTDAGRIPRGYDV